MGTIKFRAWVEGDGKRKSYMTYDNKKTEPNEEIQFAIGFNGELLECDHEHYYPSIYPTGCKLTTMQFTGLKDKNGKEIYEGDIVENEHYGRAVVRFEGAGFMPFTGDESYHSWSAQLSKVIGNIHKNPELIKTRRD